MAMRYCSSSYEYQNKRELVYNSLRNAVVAAHHQATTSHGINFLRAEPSLTLLQT